MVLHPIHILCKVEIELQWCNGAHGFWFIFLRAAPDRVGHKAEQVRLGTGAGYHNVQLTYSAQTVTPPEAALPPGPMSVSPQNHKVKKNPTNNQRGGQA